MSYPPPNPVPVKPPVGLFGGNVLVAAPTRWDEACFSTPSVRAIRSARPTCTLGVACPEEHLEYWQSVGGINHFIPYGKGRSYRQMLREESQGRITWESAILWERNAGAELAVDLKVKQRLGYPAKDLKKWLTDEVLVPPVVGPPEHRVQHYLRFMNRLHVPTQRPDLFMPASFGVSQTTGTVLVSPESDFGPTHEWHEAGWREVMELLTKKLGAKVTLVGNSVSRSGLASKLAGAFPQAQYETLNPLGPELSMISAHSLVVCADSTLSHLAAHVGVTTISLFGPNDPHWRRPLGRQHVFVRRKVECSPCLLAKCPMDMRCQKELPYDDVASAIMMKYVMP